MKILVIAPHPDDEIIGVGGTIAKRSKAGDEVYVCVITKGQEPIFTKAFVEQGRNECICADALLGVSETLFLDFPAVMLETVPRHKFNERISEVVKEIEPDEVYIPHHGDMQLDHQLVADAAMVALRPKHRHVVRRIYAYETLSETGWNIPNTINEFIPNVYEDITDTFQQKLEAMNIFKSQLCDFPSARSIGAIDALAKYRGAIVNLKAAEAFCLIREIK